MTNNKPKLNNLQAALAGVAKLNAQPKVSNLEKAKRGLKKASRVDSNGRYFNVPKDFFKDMEFEAMQDLSTGRWGPPKIVPRSTEPNSVREDYRVKVMQELMNQMYDQQKLSSKPLYTKRKYDAPDF